MISAGQLTHRIEILAPRTITNEIGEEVGARYGVCHLPSDFKKKNGYKRSCELSAQYGLYRQDYCGCVFSKHEAEERSKKA